ncbi:polyketide cyclase/dehydrase/lipid transport protein [Nocardiopsis sp. Huas11]|uniref:SRPBCC family protein n=1 Tax=Nocardiopsis sp. Huas11 TaxID=2183912 RepID=UPI000EB06F63|nr:SRPBCC family protein [Nocardiopsis sp. Huas11]RKS07677.1 polyketide cyclase/dehydrase/lipid transport protein [Nocardiopsis sp. Huas11]
MGTHKVSRSIVIDAPAARIFDILATPSRHSEVDGSGTVRGAVSGPERLEEGAEFGMDMRMFGVSYRMTNRVVEFEPDRLIAWRHIGPHRWRYELEDLEGGGTRVTETFDYSIGFSAYYVLAGLPARNAAGIEQSLLRLKDAAEKAAAA